MMVARAWGLWLTRDRVFCVPCKIAGRGWTKIANPRRECNPIDARTRRAFFAETRRAFKAHVEAEHPEWADRIDWSRRL